MVPSMFPPQNSNSRLAVILLIGSALILVAIAWRRQERAGIGKYHPAVGKAYLPMKLPPLTAIESVHEADLKGKVVLVNFWGWWCEPCQVEFPHLMELEKSLRSNPDFRFVSVASSGDPDSDEDDPELRDLTVAFLTDRRTNLPTYIDPQAAEQRRLAAIAGDSVLGYPLTIIIGRDGTIHGLWPGYREGYELQMRAVVDEALK